MLAIADFFGGARGVMKTPYEINAAINAAENAVTPLAPDQQPVTVSTKTLLALIEGAKGQVAGKEELEAKIEEMRELIAALREL